KDKPKGNYPIGAQALGHIDVDDERVYVASRNNVVWALNRHTGNQRWQFGLRQRPLFGVYLAGHVVFVPTVSTDLFMLYDHDGKDSGRPPRPGEGPPVL